MARIRRANKNSNMMVVRANEVINIEIKAGAGNADFAYAWIASTADGDPIEEASVGETVYLVVKAGESGTASVSDADLGPVAEQAGEGNTSFEVPDSDLTVKYNDK